MSSWNQKYTREKTVLVERDIEHALEEVKEAQRTVEMTLNAIKSAKAKLNRSLKFQKEIRDYFENKGNEG